jgi:26S proteasome regulatory subunit N12
LKQLGIKFINFRNEIAACSEKAYSSLPAQDAATLLYFKTTQEVYAFAKQRNWNVSPDGKIQFVKDDNNNSEIPCDQIIKIALGYSHEMEQIV